MVRMIIHASVLLIAILRDRIQSRQDYVR